MNLMQMLDHPYVKMWFWAAIVVGVLYAGYWISDNNAINDAKVYPKTVVNFLATKEKNSNDLWEQFNVANYLDSTKSYIKVDGKDDYKKVYWNVVKQTFATYTGTIDNGSTVDMPNVSLNAKQIAVGLFTTDDTLESCTNKTNGTNTTYLSVTDMENNTSDDEDICRGFDPTISRMIIAGNADDIKKIKEKVYDNAASVKDITVQADGGSAYSGLLINASYNAQ